MMIYRAPWVLPMNAPPLRDAWVAVEDGRIVECGCRTPPADGARDVDLGQAAILPGLVNAHTHLELSYLRDRVPRSPAFVGWVRTLLAARREGPRPDAPEVLAALEAAIDASVMSGTAILGDVSNSLVTWRPLVKSELAAVVFYELIGFNVQDPDRLVDRARSDIDALRPTDRVRASLAAHAPYSVAPSLFRAIKRANCFPGPSSVHLAESVEEIEFIREGTGPWRDLLQDLGAWDSSWRAPGVGPVQYLDEMGFLDSSVLAVHGVQMTPADLSRLADHGATLVTCPRSNRHTGAGAPPLETFYRADMRVAVGTDSLASTADLNLFAELAAMRALAPGVPAAVLLDSATRQGARALGFGAEYGTIEPGKRARLLAVSVPAGTDDVEEYLVSGIGPGELRWIDQAPA